MYRYLFFDLDGTLTDPKEGITRSVRHALLYFGIDVPAEELTLFIGPPLREQFMEYANLSFEDGNRAVAYYRERYADIGIFETNIIDGIPTLLAELKAQGYTLCVSSSKPEVFVKKTLDHYQLTDFFTVICGAELDGTRTKKAEVIEETLRRLSYKGNRHDILMIGDRIHDLEGAHACGIDALGVSYGYAPEGEFEEAMTRLENVRGVADTPADILKFL